MALTLFDLTYRIARELRILREGTATGGSTTTVVDSSRTEADDYWNGGTVWIVEDAGGAGAAPEGQYAKVTDFVSSTGTLTIESVGTAVASGDKYAVGKRRYPIDILIQAVNSTLLDVGTIPVVDTSSITLEDNKTEYDLPVAANDDLREVWLQLEDSDSDDNRWVPIHNWYVQSTSTGTASKLILPFQYSSEYKLKLIYMGRHDEMRDYSDKLSEYIRPERVVFPATLYCLEWYQAKTNREDSGLLSMIDKYRVLSDRVKSEAPVKKPQRQGKLMLIRGDYYVHEDNAPDTVYLG